MTRIRGVLFDAAGTLIRLREPVGATYARFAAEHGVRLPAGHVDDAFRRVFPGMPPLVAADADPAASRAAERAWWRELVRRTFRAADGSAAFRDFEVLFDALFAHYADPRAWIAAPGAEAGLRALREGGLRTGVVSNFDHRLGGLLAGLGLAPWIEVVVRPADAGAAKPDPRIFGLALARLGLLPEEAVYVGDDADDDIAGATRAGLRAVDVATLASLADVPDAIVRCEEEPRP